MKLRALVSAIALSVLSPMASAAIVASDDFNYAELIEGDGRKYSHALLGIFDAVAPQASRALAALAA